MIAVLSLASGSLIDMPGVMQVMTAAFDPRHGEAWTASQASGLLALPGVWLTLARLDRNVAGFAMARIAADEAELLLLAVDPEWRRRGIGKSLLTHFEGVATSRGARHFHLEVRAGNSAIQLYTSAGYEIVGRRRNYYLGAHGSQHDALSLARRNARSATS